MVANGVTVGDPLHYQFYEANVIPPTRTPFSAVPLIDHFYLTTDNVKKNGDRLVFQADGQWWEVYVEVLADGRIEIDERAVVPRPAPRKGTP
jgi:hypothetical protein